MSEPEPFWTPDHEPLAVQVIEFWVVHVRVALCPGRSVLGLTDKLMVAAGASLGRIDGIEWLPQPERTKTLKESKKRTKRDPFASKGTCIKPP